MRSLGAVGCSMRIMTTTDRAKAKQHWSCSAKDQSVQIFSLPHNKHIKGDADEL